MFDIIINYDNIIGEFAVEDKNNGRKRIFGDYGGLHD